MPSSRTRPNVVTSIVSPSMTARTSTGSDRLRSDDDEAAATAAARMAGRICIRGLLWRGIARIANALVQASSHYWSGPTTLPWARLSARCHTFSFQHFAKEAVHGNAGGDGEIERIHLGPDGNAYSVVGQRLRRRRQAVAFASHKKRRPRRPSARHEGVEIFRRLPRRQGDDRQSAGADARKRGRPVRHRRERHAQRRGHRRPDGFAIQRVAARRTEQHRVDAERRGVAKHAADVVRVRHAFEDDEGARPGQQLVERRRPGPLGERQAAAVKIEARDAEEVAGSADVDRRLTTERRERRLETPKRRPR